MKTLARMSFLLFHFLISALAVRSQTDFSDVERLFEEKKNVLGKDFIVMVWKKDDTLVYKKQTNPQFKSIVQAPIASASKWLTAALVMTFVDEGKLSLDDPVVNYIPEFGKYFKNYITLRHCLSQTTGIESEPIRILKLLERRKFASLEEEVNAFAAKNISENPGKEFYYGNIGLNIAGRVLEVVGKRKFDQLMTQRLFRKLAMRRTTFSNIAGGAINPSGGAKSSADDYMNFLVMLLNKGKFRGQQVLSEESVNELIKVHTTPDMIKYAPDAAKGYNYALGAWAMEEAPRPSSPNGERTATALASPGLFGTWPMIDYCHGYAYLFFVKDLLGEEKAEIHKQVKEMLDKKFASSCR